MSADDGGHGQRGDHDKHAGHGDRGGHGGHGAVQDSALKARWLAVLWPFVQAQLPPAPARILEIGCGSAGGFVPAMRRSGYRATGVDPQAPDGGGYHQVEFERYELRHPVEAVVACTSLHHVDRLDDVLDRIATALTPGGTVIVVEWAWERFDEAAARWCFQRLAEPSDESGWLQRHHDRWVESNQPWDAYFRGWVAEERLHSGETIVRGLDQRFGRRLMRYGPYVFSSLPDLSEADEQAAIEAGQLPATGIRYVGNRQT
jgi:SAM-dependent methyltransferase